jgi:uncharacterized membrane protein YccF (DUF307 family)
MGTLGNVIWLVFGGFFMFIHYAITGLVLCVTIIGIPFGLQIFKLAKLSLWPFGKDIESKNMGTGCLSLFMNIFWFFIGGIWIALHNLFWAIVLGITIIGLPFAKQHIKLASLALAPFGKRIF